MNIKIDITLSDFREQLGTVKQNSKIVIWGASSCADKFLEKLDGQNDFVAYYVDQSETKWNKKKANVIVKSPEFFFQDSSVTVVIIATMFFRNVLDTLEEKGFSGDVYSAYGMLYGKGQFDYKPLEENIEVTKRMLADEKSQNIVDFIYEHRKNMDIDFSDICEPNQYFVKDIVRIDPHAVFVDAGAYHGETIDDFIAFQKGEYDKIYSFEMDKKNYMALQSREYDMRVSLLNYGLWSERTICSYNSDDTSSYIGIDGEMMAQCVPLDEIIGDGNVTFIKMDIEGAEMNALYGAENCIKRCKPQLAICVYHKSEDIYEIASLIHEWLPEHKLYLRHHSNDYNETVLYAVP